MFRFIIFLFILFFSVFLYGCDKSEKLQERIVVFGDYKLTLTKDYITYPFSGNNLKDTEVLYSFRKKGNSLFSDSLVIFLYKLDFPNSKDTFFSIVKDKLLRNLKGSEILDSNDFNLDGSKVYYFIYEYNDSLFDDNKKYYGLQAYIFTNKHDIYIISYISIDLENVKNILSRIKDLKFNK